MKASAHAGVADGSTKAIANPLAFTLRQEPLTIDGPQPIDALLVTLAFADPLAEGLAPYVAIEGYEPEPRDATDRSRAFLLKDQAGAYLTWEKGKRIPRWSVVIPDLDILECQDAIASVALSRNEELVAGRPSAKPFVYQTPVVAFPTPLHPSVDSEAPIDLASVFAGAPERRSLFCQLSLLYEALFAAAGTNSVTLGMTARYEYAISPALPKVCLPVFLQPPTRVRLAEGGEGLPLAQATALQVAGCLD